MARTYARLWCAAWTKVEFRRLEVRAQWLYFAMISQPSIGSTGLLTINVAKWSSLAVDMTGNEVEHALKMLEHAHMIVIDTDTNELVIRTFIKHDGGYRNPPRLAAISAEYRSVISVALKAAIYLELTRLHVDVEAPEGPTQAPPEAPYEGTYEGAPQLPRTFLNHNHNLNLIPEPKKNTPSTASTSRPILNAELLPLFDEFWSVYPKRAGKAEAQRKFAIAVRGTEAAVIIAAAQRFALTSRSEEPRFIPHPATWLHQGRWADDLKTTSTVVVTKRPEQTW